MKRRLPDRLEINCELRRELDEDERESEREEQRQSWRPGQWARVCKMEKDFGVDFNDFCEKKYEENENNGNQ
jgi:hypothetical protein